MGFELVTGNHAAGYALSVAGEANRDARGAACGIYPITPQTEIVEFIAKYPFSKGKVVAVESEHSAMGVAIGASLAGSRAFTASSSNGIAYMFENIMVAGFYRLPIVMVGVNRTLGPPWNIWADQGDSLMLRDLPWIQLYCETNQEVLDTSLLAFRLSENAGILLPTLVLLDGFILSHTLMETDLPEQELVDRYLPACGLPHAINHEKPNTYGGLMWPREALSHRKDIDESMDRVPGVFEESREAFQDVFGRDPGGVIETTDVEDADVILITSGTVATTTREVVRARRKKGERIGMVKMKMFRPFPTQAVLDACANVKKVAVLDRNYAAGLGGIFWQEIRAAMQGKRDDMLVQGYLTGVGGGDVTPSLIDEIIDDIVSREEIGEPVWKGLES